MYFLPKFGHYPKKIIFGQNLDFTQKIFFDQHLAFIPKHFFLTKI